MVFLRTLTNQRRCRLQDGRSAAHGVSKAQHRNTEAIRLTPKIVFEISGRSQRLREPADSGLGQPCTLDEIAVAEQCRAWTKSSQQFQPALDRAIRDGASAGIFYRFAIR